jgi:aldose 1-epimerase
MKRNRSILCAGILMIASIAQAVVNRADWGKTADDQSISIFTLTDRDLTVRITNFGARIVSIEAPDRDGKKADVVLGYDKASQYIADTSTYFGAVVGRYGNRIAKGTFSIDGQVVHVPTNDKTNALHGGTIGFDRKVWAGRELHDGVEMTLLSPDGDMGFPGALTVHVRYTLEGKSLHISYSASSTRPTVVNLTNHSYFNLAGNGKGTVLDHVLTIPADRYTPVDAVLIPTSELAPVTQTPFDFRTATAIGMRINTSNEQLKRAGGYDHNFVMSETSRKLHLAAQVLDPSSGRTLTVSTTEPGLQFYSGNFLDGTKTGKFDTTYRKYAGFCLETQHFPDSPNEPSFPSTLLKPGQTFQSETIFTFDVQHW